MINSSQGTSIKTLIQFIFLVSMKIMSIHWLHCTIITEWTEWREHSSELRANVQSWRLTWPRRGLTYWLKQESASIRCIDSRKNGSVNLLETFGPSGSQALLTVGWVEDRIENWLIGYLHPLRCSRAPFSTNAREFLEASEFVEPTLGSNHWLVRMQHNSLTKWRKYGLYESIRWFLPFLHKRTSHLWLGFFGGAQGADRASSDEWKYCESKNV